jgi:hypothetical protein
MYPGKEMVNLAIVQPLPQSVCQLSDQLRCRARKRRPASIAAMRSPDRTTWRETAPVPLPPAPSLLFSRSPNSPCHRRLMAMVSAKIPPTCGHFPEILTASCSLLASTGAFNFVMSASLPCTAIRIRPSLTSSLMCAHLRQTLNSCWVATQTVQV